VTIEHSLRRWGGGVGGLLRRRKEDELFQGALGKKRKDGEGFFLFIERNAYPLEDWKLEFLMIHWRTETLELLTEIFRLSAKSSRSCPFPCGREFYRRFIGE